MLKAVIGISSVIVGCGLFVMVGQLQSDRFIFTSLHNEPSSVSSSIRALEPAPSVELSLQETPEATAELIALPGLEIKGLAAPALRAPATRMLEPCSAWIELGPTAVATSKTSPTRHVQLMCLADKRR